MTLEDFYEDFCLEMEPVFQKVREGVKDDFAILIVARNVDFGDGPGLMQFIKANFDNRDAIVQLLETMVAGLKALPNDISTMPAKGGIQ